ncbi:hypothetical protein [Actinomadura barringtoniae]|nr:hypothetical protein [Actinomadura barringtoniae]
MELHDRRVLSFGAAVPEGVVDAGTSPGAGEVEALVAAGKPVMVTETTTAAVAVYAWLGASVFRVPDALVGEVRQVVEMVLAIRGLREPAVSRRGLA